MISGNVVGVFFRNFIRDNAIQLGLCGHVRNKEDGRVEAWLEGEKDKVEEMIKRCSEGPPQSQVKEVEVEEQKLQGFKEFKVLHI